MSLLEVEGLTKAWSGRTVLEDVGFALDAGAILAVIGPNGAGKSTCFNILGGQVRPDAGRVLLDGRDITGWRPGRIGRAGVGRTFQITATMGSLSVLDNVRLALLAARRRHLDLFRRASKLCRDEAMDLLARLAIEKLAGRACGLLAYGDLKRVELAVALAGRPRLLLMDEPTAGMAQGERQGLMQLVADIAGRENIAVLFTEHDMDIVFGHAARIIVLHQGRILASGDPDSLRRDARVREVYLGREDEP